MASDIGTGSKIKFGSTIPAMPIMSIAHSGIGTVDIKTSHLGTTGGHTYIPGDLYEPGEIKVEWQVDNATVSASGVTIPFPPYKAAAQTFTVYLTGTTAGKPTIAGSGFVKDVDYGAPNEELMTGSFSIKMSGNLTHGVA